MRKLFVGNLPQGCDKASLVTLFSKYGKVEECDIIKNHAFVHMSTVAEGAAAISGLNYATFMDRIITVKVSTSRLRRDPGMGNQGHCFHCGAPGHWYKDCPENTFSGNFRGFRRFPGLSQCR
ncbi:RNA-binding protein 4.1-like isoform X2 [Amblyomma americanum]